MVKVWKTNNIDSKFKSIDIKELKLQESDCEKTININSQNEYQEILGFGGAFNEIGGRALKELPLKLREEVLNELFSTENCNFNLNRTPIGASDFALDAYSLNDTENDFEMNNFSIERDKLNLIPYIKSAQKVNPAMKLWSCPWSPPAWMKTTKSMVCGGELINTQENLRAYSLYLSRYLEAYKKEGIDIFAFCVQNETDVINVYPTSTMPAELMRDFIRAYLIPELMRQKKFGVTSELWIGTIRDVVGYADTVVNDYVIKRFAKGIGYQYSSAATVGDTYKKQPSIKLLHTESPCHNGANSWKEAKEIFDDILMYLENGCSNYCYWNMILDENEASSWGWSQNSLLTIDRNEKSVKYNPEFYVMKHFSHFIKPGAKRIETSGDYGNSVISFKNEDETIFCMISNFSDKNKKIKFNVDGRQFNCVLEKDSIYTVQIN